MNIRLRKILDIFLAWWPIMAIFLVALVIRLYRLGSLPMNLQEDEVMTGYVGRFILQNGKDVYGNPWPLWYFDKFGDYYIVLPIYLKGLSILIFGVNEFAIRFPSAFLGALSVVPIVLLSYFAFNSKKIGYIAAFILAILPWHITLSRASSEGIMGIFFYGMGLALLTGFMKLKKKRYIIGSIIFFLISYWIYHPYRIVVPLTLMLALVISLLSKAKRNIVPFVMVFLVFTLITGYISTTKWGRGRFAQTSIFSQLSGVSIRLQELIYNEGQQNILVARIFNNKLLGYGREFVRQYSTYFSGEYLFVKGGLSLAYDVPEMGLLYISLLIPFITAIMYLSRGEFPKEQKRIVVFLIILFFLIPIPASLTYVDAPNIQRSVDMVIFFSIFAGYGIYQLIKLKGVYKIILPIFVVLIGIESILFWHNYTVHTDLFTSMYRNDGQKQLIEYVIKNKNKYEKIFLPVYGTMSMYYLYFSNDFDPSYIGKIKYDVRLDRSNNVFFVDSGCTTDKITEEDMKKNVLIVNKNNCTADSIKFTQINSVWGANKLLNFNILIPNSHNQIK